MGQIQSLEEFLNLLVRRRWLILAVALIGALMSAVYAKSRPDTYETAAVIQVESAAVQGAEAQRNSAAAATLQLIEQRLTTRENLAVVIERHGLYAGLPLSIDKKIDMLRSAVSFQGVDSAAGQTFGEARNLSRPFWCSPAWVTPTLRPASPMISRKASLTNRRRDSGRRADQNVAFFRQEVARIGEAITLLEAETVAYKNANTANLPEVRDAQRDELVSLDTDLRRLQQDMVALTGEAAQINAKATLRETDRRALDDIAARRAVLEAQITSTTARQAEIEADLAASPEVERVLATYDRQLDQLRSQQDAATTRMVQAETDARLAELQQAERFTLLERAIVPESAMGGGNKKLAIAGAVASLVAGVVLAFVLDLMHPVVRTAAQMERQLDLRPVVTIPEIKPEKAGRGAMKLLDDPTKPFLGLPRYAVISGAVTLVLLAAAAIV
jgi:tyrosine-protein kinase Etk/Wzc